MSAQREPLIRRGERRYHVGCAGQFVLQEQGSGYLHGTYDDELEAFVACGDETAPLGAYVLDTHTGDSFGPSSYEELAEARKRLEARHV